VLIAVYLQVVLKEHGFNKQQIGLLQGLLGMMAVFAPPLWGYFSDATARPRLILTLGILGYVPLFLLLGMARGMPAAIALIIAFGFFNRPIIPLTDGYTFRYIHHHGGDYGKVRCAGSISGACTMFLLELLGAGGSSPVGVILSSMAVLGSFHLVSIFSLPADEDVRLKKTYRPDLRVFLMPGFLFFTLAAFLGNVAMSSYYHFFTLFLKEQLGFSKAGLIWTLGTLSEIPVVYFSGRIMKRIGVRNLFALGLLGCVLRLAGFSVVTNVWQAAPLQLFHMLTFGAFFTASVTYVSRLVPPNMKSSAQTLFAALSTGLGSLVGGALGGVIVERYGFSALYRVFGGIGLAGLIILLAFVPAERQKTA